MSAQAYCKTVSQLRLEHAIISAVAATLTAKPDQPLAFLSELLPQPPPPAAATRFPDGGDWKEYLNKHPEIEAAVSSALALVVSTRPSDAVEAAVAHIRQYQPDHTEPPASVPPKLNPTADKKVPEILQQIADENGTALRGDLELALQLLGVVKGQYRQVAG